MITKKDLLKWLEDIDAKLKNRITLIAVGGTAMTLLNLKESTIDVDFDISRENFNEFKKLTSNSKKFRVDIFVNGYIFSEQLPEDYVLMAEELKNFKFNNINLKTLHPLDIIITKAARYNARDDDDIRILTKKIKIDAKKLRKRFEIVLESYAGSESVFKENFNVVLNRYFRKL